MSPQNHNRGSLIGPSLAQVPSPGPRRELPWLTVPVRPHIVRTTGNEEEIVTQRNRNSGSSSHQLLVWVLLPKTTALHKLASWSEPEVAIH